MPDWLTVVLLGIIEGITEFLPISSTGHLLLVQNAGLLDAQSELFNVVIQSGAVVAVLAVFWRRTVALATGLHDPKQRDYLVKLLVSFVLTGMGGVLLKAVGFELPETVGPVAIATFVGGVLILLAERRLAGKSPHDQITWTICIAVAAAQLLAAAFPGTSRSGACIVAAMLLGLNRPLAVEFSFLVGVPTLLSAGALELTLSLVRGEASDEDWGLVALGTAVSAVVAFIAVRWLLQFVAREAC
jgi:undecaprenyl-diphosphatase